MDLISRQAAIDCFGFTWPEDAIRNLPSAEPKRIRGKWVPITNGRLGHECNQCHEYAPSYQSGEEHLSDFCPNCGADMRGEQYG